MQDVELNGAELVKKTVYVLKYACGLSLNAAFLVELSTLSNSTIICAKCYVYLIDVKIDVQIDILYIQFNVLYIYIEINVLLTALHVYLLYRYSADYVY